MLFKVMVSFNSDITKFFFSGLKDWAAFCPKINWFELPKISPKICPVNALKRFLA